VYTFVGAIRLTGFPMPKEKIINIRVDSEMKKTAKKLAESEGRSLSNWIIHLIQKEINKHKK
jgi:predicted HicB family RNase H-like nuclease